MSLSEKIREKADALKLAKFIQTCNLKEFLVANDVVLVDDVSAVLEGYVAVPREQLQKFQDWLSKEANEPAKFQWEIQRKQAFKEVIEKAEDLLRDDGKRPTK